MATDEEKAARIERALKAVVNALEDAQKGLVEIGEHLKDPDLKAHFLAESLRRANFRGELENELHRQGVADVHETGTGAGMVYRAWAGLKAALGGGDSSLLVSAQEAEDEELKTYRDALEQELPLPLRQMLAEQEAQIQLALEFVRNRRTTLKSR